MWRFHRYYLREMLLNLGMTFLMLFGVALLALLARGISRTQGQDMWLALWVTLLWAIDIVPDLLAISTLIATVFTFGRAAGDNEITAIRMAGVSPLRLLGSVLIVGTLTAGLNTYLLHNLIPYAHYKKYRPFEQLAEQWVANLRPSNNRIEMGDRLVMAWHRQDEQGRWIDVQIKAEGSDGNSFEGFAKRVWMEKGAREGLIYLKLQGPEGYRGGEVHNGKAMRGTIKLDQNAVIRISFDVREIAEKGKRAEGIKDLPTAQLVAEYERGGSENPEVSRWMIWLRSFKGFASLLFAVVAFPIGVLSKRSGRMAALSMSAIPLTIYFVCFYLAPGLARLSGELWPVALPSAVMLVLIWILMRRAFRV
ncbi:MAG: hypothetical protein CSA62_04425 [Planctomycetota bacterium]|nr:MAG: hypothetical protein CSA62_04425 [Planctomycetota bacterium]